MKIISFVTLLLLCTQGRSNREKRSVLTTNERTINLAQNDPNVRIECDFYKTEIWVTSSFLQNNISIVNPQEGIFLNQDSSPISGCSRSISGNFNKTFSRFAECSSAVVNQDDCLVVSYRLCLVASIATGPVRDIPTVIDFSCLFTRNLTTNTFKISPRIKKISLNNVLASGQFVTKFDRCTTSSCATSTPFSTQIFSGDRIYVQLTNSATTSLNLVLQTMQCWATNSSDYSAMVRYNIIDNGCPMDTTIIYENFLGNRTRFSFEAFTWTDPRNGDCFYIHCRVVYCTTVNGRNCSIQQACAKRKRRSTELGGDGEIISSGPITVLPNTCDKKSLGCSYDCKTGEQGSFVCYCPSGYSLAQDLKTCRKIISPKSGFFNGKNEESVIFVERSSNFSKRMSIGLLGMVLVILGVLFWHCKKRTNESDPILKKERLI